jgi:type IV pilus biogenesis protein CpaD/CtpE
MTRPQHHLLLVTALLVLAGCRTYGDEGYESGPKTYSAIQQTVQQTEQDLNRAESDLRRLQSAAASADTLEGLADRYQSLVESHATTLAAHREQAERLSAESAYRTLNRVYGAMVTDRRLLRLQYERTTRKVWATVRDSTMPRAPRRSTSDYSITPVQYPRPERPDISMAEALRGVGDTPGLQMEEQPADVE